MPAKKRAIPQRRISSREKDVVKDLVNQIRKLSTEVAPDESLSRNIRRVVDGIEASKLPEETQRRLLNALKSKRERLFEINRGLAKETRKRK